MTFGRRDELKTALLAIGTGGYVAAKDVLTLRAGVFKDGIVSSDELDALFDLASRAPEGDPEWAHFFAEAAADFYLREEHPHGYLTEDEFQSLKARTAREGRVNALTLGLCVTLLEKAIATPPAMTEFIAEQIALHVRAKKNGPRLSADDVNLTRRFIFACGGAGNVAVARREAEFLFDLADMTADAANDPSWTEFFVRALANHVMAHIGYEPLSHDDAKALYAFMADRDKNVGGFLTRMVRGALAGLKAEEPSLAAQRNAARERDAAEAEKVTPEEAEWLAARIGRDGALHADEQALVEHLRSLGANLPPKLKTLVGAA